MARRRAIWVLITTGVLCLAAWAGFVSWHELSVINSDHTPFEYNHQLPRNYEDKTRRNLLTLQVALIDYAQHHNGTLPPLRSSSEAITALRPYIRGNLPWRVRNPATESPFTPNAALSNERLAALPSGGHTIAFYDAHPPVNYPESYYVTIKGTVAHVPVATLPRLLSSQKVNNVKWMPSLRSSIRSQADGMFGR